MARTVHAIIIAPHTVTCVLSSPRKFHEFVCSLAARGSDALLFRFGRASPLTVVKRRKTISRHGGIAVGVAPSDTYHAVQNALRSAQRDARSAMNVTYRGERKARFVAAPRCDTSTVPN